MISNMETPRVSSNSPICLTNVQETNPPAILTPKPSNLVACFPSCFFCKAKLNSRENAQIKKCFSSELYGNVFRRACFVINSTNQLIEQIILNLSNEKVKALVHLCESCRGLAFHLYRVLENSETKQRSIISEEVRVTKDILTFKILQAAKRVNLFPLPEGQTNTGTTHMFWETKLREMECVANLSNPAVCAALKNGKIFKYSYLVE